MATASKWFYANDGEQLGPVTVEELQELAANGTITVESNIWTEGLVDWVRATQVDGLFEEESPEPARTQGSLASLPNAAALKPVTTAASIAPAPQPIAGVAAGENYPTTPVNKAGFGKLMFFSIGGPIVMIVGLVAGLVLLDAGSSGPSGSIDDPTATMGGLLILGSYAFGTILGMVGSVFAMIYLFRAWDLLKWGAPRTTAGTAVGFLFIPYFNLYWMFVAYSGLAKDWNRVMASHPDLALAPRMNEGMFLAYCICSVSIIGIPIAMILWFVMHADICRGINFMASRATIGAKPAGLNLY